MARVGYMRVSTIDQRTDRQLEGVELDKLFKDHCSGKDMNRPALRECLTYLREGDVLHVHSIDRLARNLQDLQGLVTDLNGRGVSVCFKKEGLTFTAGNEADPMSKLMLQLLGSFSEFERSMIRERQREGLELAKKQGRKLGRAKALKPEQVAELVARAKAGESKAHLAKEYGISRVTLYAYLAEAGQP